MLCFQRRTDLADIENRATSGAYNIVSSFSAAARISTLARDTNEARNCELGRSIRRENVADAQIATFNLCKTIRGSKKRRSRARSVALSFGRLLFSSLAQRFPARAVYRRGGELTREPLKNNRSRVNCYGAACPAE